MWNYFYLFYMELFVAPSSEDSCLSPILEISQPYSIWILLPPLSSTIIHILIEGGSRVNSMGNNLVKEARLTFLSQFCRLGPADLEEAGAPPSWSLAGSPCTTVTKGVKFPKPEDRFKAHLTLNLALFLNVF